jgi:hypothetical protein
VGSPQYNSISRGDEGKGGNNDLVSRFDLKKERRHFERMRAGSRQQHLADPELLFEKGVTFIGKLAVSRELPVGHGLSHKLKLFSR